MIVVLSGEGPTDLGISATGSEISLGPDFLIGPMTKFVHQLLSPDFVWLIEFDCFRLVNKISLAARARGLRPTRLPGKKHTGVSAPFFKLARALAVIAEELRVREAQDHAIAILFKDADDNSGTASGKYREKWDAATDGFAVSDFVTGVPMIPRPISEAWLVCAFKIDPYQHCEQLEDESRSERSPSGLKQQLKEVLGEPASKDALLARFDSGSIDAHRIVMPSFNDFKKRLAEVLTGRQPA